MKILLLMGRGIEGCGVTKFTLEQYRFYKDRGDDPSIIAIVDKSWTRKNSHDVDHIRSIKLAGKTADVGYQALLDTANSCDFIVINSLPSQAHDEKCQANFSKFLKACHAPIVLVQHDHSSLSIKRNACITDAIDAARVIFVHSKTNDFAKLVREQTATGGLESFLGDDLPTEKAVFSFQPGLDLDAIRAKYWKPITETNPIMHKWIGRTTSWKGYVQMFKFHNEFLRPAGFITTFEGIEKSPAYLAFRELSEFHGHIAEPIESVKLNINEPAYVFGPFVNSEMLQRMSRCGFGYQLSVLDEKYIERSVEYTHLEVVCSGVVPVFRKKYGERCHHRKTGKPLIEHENSGTIWLDDNDMTMAFAQVMAPSKDEGLRNALREEAFDFYESHQDSAFTFSEMHENMMTEFSKKK